MAISLTEAAANRVEKFLANRGKGIGLRLGVKTTGCSGMAYTLEFVDDMQPEDMAFDSHGVKVIVDPKSLAYIDGTELDFTKEGLNEGFKFNNPNVKDEFGAINISQAFWINNYFHTVAVKCHVFRLHIINKLKCISHARAASGFNAQA